MSSEPSVFALLPGLVRRRARVVSTEAPASRSLASSLARWRLPGRAVLSLAPGVLPVLLLFLWSLSVRRGWVSELILPAPSLVWDSFKALWEDGTIQNNIAVSSGRVAKGFFFGSSLGLLLGTWLGLSAKARAYFQPTFVGLYQVNLLAWIPLFILLVGIDEGLKVTAVAWATLLPVTVNTLKGVRGISPHWLELARVFHLNRSQVLYRVAVPAALPSIFTGLRTGLAAAWTSLVLVELIASSEGIGYMVVWGRQLFQLDIVTVAIVLIGLIGLSLDLGLRLLERRLRAWHFALAS